ncbi:CCA tRNA nucleotidyltransferase [Bordetella genomosp. 13]|uniref:CCA tRNA nucleotidyltransferase n=1 Tax=Bordetella genomosp. 13 TaxID=463040 RepID=UPI0028D850C8|nr:CCA tRNA nucleotidyltransferase [Bordetella genomosp. 13]
MSAAKDPAVDGLQAYVVGGAVRDEMLGLPAGDRDWVVVGSTPEEMSRRGFVPVGGDFPVFLHPRTKEEYALARTERKSGRGYQGFTFYTGADVTLEQDLLRRDLTVNAMARTPEGALVDPLDGAADLRARVFRHVGEAFSEDPVRILRLARFAARFGDFTVADDTLRLCRDMVEAGEADALVPERVWKEMSRGLMAETPSRMLDVLGQAGALARVAPGLQWTDAHGSALDEAARAGLPLASRYAVLARTADDAPALGRRWRVPAECADYARLLQPMLAYARQCDAPDAERALALIETCDGLRKPERFAELVRAAALLHPFDAAALMDALARVRAVDAGEIARGLAGDPSRIKEAVRAARLRSLSSPA